MRHRELGPFLLIVVLAGCSPATDTSGPSSVLAPGVRAAGSSLTIKTLYDFGYHQSDGVKPQSALDATESCAQTCEVDLFGTTAAGGANNAGTIYDVAATDVTTESFDERTVMSFSPANTGSDPTSSVLTERRHGEVMLFATASQGGPHDDGTVVKPGTGAVLAFNGRDGAVPTAGLAAGPRQVYGFLLYATTSKGGAHHVGAITAVRLSKNAFTPKVLYSFVGTNSGEHPNSKLATDGFQDSPYYGTTSGSKNVPGTVYEFTSAHGDATVTTLYRFENATSGAEPTGVTVLPGKQSGQVLYGTTVSGGASGYGTLYELRPNGSTYAMVKLHDFAGGNTDGANPQGAPSFIKYSGTFDGVYGVTENGGAYGCGTIFQYDFTSSKYAVIYSFACGKDGGHPKAGLAFGATGVGVVGTTSAGGAYHDGTVFAFNPF